MPTPDRFDRADQLFDQALDLPAAERGAFLDRATAGDPELRALVERLLGHAETAEGDLPAGGALAGPLAAAAADALEEPETLEPGTRIDRYRLLGEIGRGGMSVVYLAERADGVFEGRVALKALKRGLDTDEVLARFRRERQILAGLRHPAIARLLDGGSTPDGRPYFVLEHVPGEAIDRHANRLRLGLAARLELFASVARAVEHAHRNLIVHRDLKPSNILVTAEGEVKLLDFGIAKLLGAELAPALTRTTGRLLTPAYASPEQVLGGPVTTASDVYQLGLLLYLLLTGTWPYRSFDASAETTARVICEEEPTRPSSRVDEAGAARLAISPRELRRGLAGDLDTILLTALRKEPERRYGSVALLLADLEHWRQGRPIAARPDTLAYRAGKFLGRHRVAAGIAATALLLLAAVITVAALRLARERDRATLAAAEAQQVADFLRSLFEVAAPSRSKGERITARELLDRGAERVEAELSGQPRQRAAMMEVIGTVYHDLAHFEEAAAQLEGALALRRASGAEDRAALAGASLALAAVRADQARLVEARALYEEVRAASPGGWDRAAALHGLGNVARLSGDYPRAKQLLEAALAELEGDLGPDDPRLGAALLRLAETLRETLDLEAALRHAERALVLLCRSHEPDHPKLADAAALLADLRYRTGDTEAARHQYREALPLLERAYGGEHPVLAEALTGWGLLLAAEGEFEPALAAQKRAQEIRQIALGPDHPLVAESLATIGSLYRRQGKYEAARDYLARGLAALEASLGPEHPEVATALTNLGDATAWGGDPPAALPLFERALALRRKHFAADHPLLLQPLMKVGRVRLELGRAAEAEAPLREALALGRKLDPTGQHGTLMPGIALAHCLALLGQGEEARQLLNAAASAATDSNAEVRRRFRAAEEALARPKPAG